MVIYNALLNAHSFSSVNISIGNIDILGRLHDCKWIAAIPKLQKHSNHLLSINDMLIFPTKKVQSLIIDI